MYKDNAVGNVVAETGRDFGTTVRRDLSMPLTGELRRSPEPSARPSAAADSKERQVCATCLFTESVGLCFCFLPSCAMYKDNPVGNVVAETGRDLVFMTTARLSYLSMPLKGEVRRSPEQCAWQPIAGSGKFVRHASSRRALGCEKTTVLCFLPSWSTLLFERGWGKRGDLTWHPAVKHQRPAAKTTNSNCCDRAVAQVKQRPNNQGETSERTASTDQMSKKGIKFILKTIGNRKGDCA